MKYINLRLALIVFLAYNYIDTYNHLISEKNLSILFGESGELTPAFNRVEYFSFSSLYFAVITLYSIGLIYLIIGIYQIDKKNTEIDDFDPNDKNFTSLFNKKIENTLSRSKKLMRIASFLMILISLIGSLLLFSDWSYKLILTKQLGVFVLSFYCIDLIYSIFLGGLELKKENELTI